MTALDPEPELVRLPWSTPLEATTFAGSCAHLASIQGPASENEDCLYLNVWTPEPAPPKPLPVMVWFHGGGNQQGSAGDPVPFPGTSCTFYEGRLLAEKHRVVVVTINYRLNAFGFFAHAEVLYRDTGHRLDRERRAAAGVAIDLGEN